MDLFNTILNADDNIINEIVLDINQYKTEIWKKISANYYASSFGRIKNNNGIILKPIEVETGYMVELNARFKNVDRLIAETFIDNPHNLRGLAHRDGNVYNNNVNNLFWYNTNTRVHLSFINDLQLFDYYIKYNNIYLKDKKIEEIIINGKYLISLKSKNGKIYNLNKARLINMYILGNNYNDAIFFLDGNSLNIDLKNMYKL